MPNNLMNIAHAVDQMKKLIPMIQCASDAYYVDDNPIMSDKQYDELCDELAELESSTGIVLANSPLHKVQGKTLDCLEKVKHTEPMLSAAKTKDPSAIQKFQGDNVLCASWKLDGATMLARYRNGKFYQAITRGDGYIGEDVTENAKTITNLPLEIPYKGDLEVRGECVISRKTFAMLQKRAGWTGEKIGHPRNVASGALRQLDPAIAAEKYLEFKVFNSITELPDVYTKVEQLTTLQSLGFDVVEWKHVPYSNIVPAIIEDMNPEKYPYFVDGIIFEIDDLVKGKAMGCTAHHPKSIMALKWADDTVETTFRRVALNVTRTGTVSLTAEFDPVQIENTMVGSATLHNVDYFNALELGDGDRITVYKANMVIPAIDDNLTRSGTYKLPTYCPCCGTPLILDGAFLKCPNQICPAQTIRRFKHFASKQAMNIEGLSESTIDKLVGAGIIKTFDDFYHLHEHRLEILKIEGLGKRSYEKLVDAVERSRMTTMAKFIVAMGIPFVGVEAAKELEEYFDGDYQKFVESAKANTINIKGFGDVMKANLQQWANDESDQEEWNRVVSNLTFVREEKKPSLHPALGNQKIVITGTVDNMHRSEMKKVIESMGGKVTDSITKTTDILILGDNAGSKLDKAKKLNIPIMSWEEFVEEFECVSVCGL